MNTATHPTPAGGVNTRQLWAAVAVLGIAVVALGASLVHIMTRPLDGHMALAALEPATTSAQQESIVTESRTPLPVTTVGQGETVLATPAPSALPRTAQPAPPAIVHQSPSTPLTQPLTPLAKVPSVSAPTVLPVPAAVVIGTQSNAPMVLSEGGLLASRPISPQPRAVCATCGRVESVRAVERKGEAQGVGAVAGNTIERNTSKTIVYQVQVRMEDGSLRTVEQSSAPAIGSAVFVEGQQMRAADSTVPVSRSYAPAPAFVPQARIHHNERY